jgi:hypothetical protein
MKVNEIVTESVYDYLTKFGQQGKQAAWARGGAEKYYADQRAQAQAAHATQPQPVAKLPAEGTVLLVTATNGQQYFKSYNGTWHAKGTIPQEFSVGGTKITNPAEISALDGLLPQAKLVGVKPDPKDNTGQAFLYDQRKTALLAKRRGKK